MDGVLSPTTRRLARTALAGLAAGLFLASPATAQLAVERITAGPTGFSQPLAAVAAPGQPSTLYVVQKGGAIRSIDLTSPTATPQPFLSLDNQAFPGSDLYAAGALSGLLGLAFHPGYESNGIFFAFYTADGNRELRLDQFRATNGVVDAGVRRNVLTIPASSTGSEANLGLRHAGGWIGFSPTTQSELTITVGDGPYVFVGTPDPENNAQNTSNLLGTVLRIDVGPGGLDFSDPASTYTIPAGKMTVNPNGSLASPAPPSLVVQPEIFAYPHAAVADEGVPPPALIGQSVTGGYVYRGPAFPDYGGDLQGTYLFADYQTNQFASFRYDPETGQLSGFRDRTSEILGSLPAGVSLSGVASFAEDGAGNLYMLSITSGDVFRIMPVPEPRGLLAAALAAAAAAWRLRRGMAWGARRKPRSPRHEWLSACGRSAGPGLPGGRR